MPDQNPVPSPSPYSSQITVVKLKDALKTLSDMSVLKFADSEWSMFLAGTEKMLLLKKKQQQ